MAGRQSPGLAATRLRAWLRQGAAFDADAPIPLDALVAELGLTVASFDERLHPGVLGYLEPGEDLIFLRADLTETMRRFTLAHELGHALLHRRSGLAAEIGAAAGDEGLDALRCEDLDVETDAADEDETLRPGQVYSMRAQREGEANAFAAALLLPATATLTTYAALCARNAERPSLALAQRFGVSEEVALRRLVALLTHPDEERDETAAQAFTPAAPLDADQRRAARTHAPALIVAGPGSGKTSALLARIAYLTTERGVAPERILALTFSRKATEELGARLARALGEQSATPRINTIHAFCGDTLRRYAPLVGLRPDFRLVTEIEGYFLLRRIVNHAPLVHYTPLSGPTMLFRELLRAISRAKDDLKTPADVRQAADAMARDATSAEEREAAERAMEVATLYASYQAALDERGDVDYGDLIARMAQLLREEPQVVADLRARYEHVLVDEFQDINRAMRILLRTLMGSRGALWAVGDADQAIYRFRGASPAAMRHFAHDYHEARVIPLGRNYRSRPQILRAASAFATAFLPGADRLALIATRDTAPAQPAVILASAPDAGAELDGLARMMRERVVAGVPLREQAVLLRTRDHVKQVCDGLRARGIPAQLAAPLLEQPLIKTLLATISLTVDPLASGLLRAGVQPDHTFSADDARALLKLAREQHTAPFAALRMETAENTLTQSGLVGLRQLDRLIAALRSSPSVTVGMRRYIFSHTLLGARLLEESARAEAAQVARLLGICQTYDDQRASGALLGAHEAAPLMADWAGLLDYLGAMRALGLESGAATLADDADAALVLTAHAGKGLEFPVVYLPHLVNSRFPLSVRAEQVPLPPGLLDDMEETANEPVRDEANLFYVSLTRARDTLALSYAEHYGKRAYAPSPFLKPIEEELALELERQRWESAPSAASTGSAESAAEEVAPDATEAMAGRTFSLSQLLAYERCPQQYAFEYVEGLRPALAPPVSLKSAYKAASAELRSRFAAGAMPTRAEALALFDERWNAARAEALRLEDATALAEGDETLSGVYRLHGARAFERLWRALARGDAEPVEGKAETLLGAGATQAVSVTFAGATITGSLDHVEDVAGNAQDAHETRAGAADIDTATRAAGRIVRYTQGKLGGSLALSDLFYALAAEQLRPDGQPLPVVRVSLASGDAKPLSVAGQRRRLEQAASAALAGLARENYPPKPSARTCPTCPFALICPA